MRGWRRGRKGQEDPHLAALLFQYGRYLLIASSRPRVAAGQPPGHLERQLRAAWFSDYTINVNTEMNYLARRDLHLPITDPLFTLIERLREPGRRAARERYGCRGWVLGTRTPAWALLGLRASVDSAVARCGRLALPAPLGALPVRAQPQLPRPPRLPGAQGNLRVLLDFLVADPRTGELVAGPATSPENRFIGPDGQKYSISMGPTMSMQLIRDVFSQCIAASEMLGVDEPFRRQLIEARAKLAPTRIGRRGQLQEWLEDYPEADPQHRHVSHLYGLHPSNRSRRSSAPNRGRAAIPRPARRWRHWLEQGVEDQLLARLQRWRSCPPELSELLEQHSAQPLRHASPFRSTQLRGHCGHAEILRRARTAEVHLLPALPSAGRMTRDRPRAPAASREHRNGRAGSLRGRRCWRPPPESSRFATAR